MSYDPNALPIPARTSTDVMIGSYVSTSDPATVPANSVLPGKFWVQIDSGGAVVALKVRNAANSSWSPVNTGAGQIKPSPIRPLHSRQMRAKTVMPI